MSKVLNVWKLRTHPFRQPMDDKGELLPADALFSTLNPAVDQRLLRLYFNLYDWDKSEVVKDIDRDKVLLKFPDELRLKESNGILILIAGQNSEGRESLQNLILHKISLDNQASPPLVVSAKFDGQNQVQNVKLVARNFLRRLKPVITADEYDDLVDLYTAETKEDSSGTDSVYSNLFLQLNDAVTQFYNRPFVLLVSGGDHYDTWETVYNSTRDLFKYILVVTTDETEAESCAKHLPSNSVAVIKAQRLDLPKTKDYLKSRLDDERSAPMKPEFALAPFGEEALTALFKRGSNPDLTQPVRLPIGRLNRILSQALDLHVVEVAKIAQQQNKDLSELNTEDTLISRDTVMNAINTI